jgi:hypothetical protein
MQRAAFAFTAALLGVRIHGGASRFRNFLRRMSLETRSGALHVEKPRSGYVPSWR